jgi:hypothetical protein
MGGQFFSNGLRHTSPLDTVPRGRKLRFGGMHRHPGRVQCIKPRIVLVDGTLGSGLREFPLGRASRGYSKYRSTRPETIPP